jgi:hypothetical protein
VQTLVYDETNTSAPVMLAVAGLEVQPISWLDETLDVHIVGVIPVEAATQVSVNQQSGVAYRTELSLSLPVAAAASLLCFLLVSLLVVRALTARRKNMTAPESDDRGGFKCRYRYK